MIEFSFLNNLKIKKISFLKIWNLGFEIGDWGKLCTNFMKKISLQLIFKIVF